ncbi:hypothetical protein A7U60_g4044 [Sanghuangporus baumii]|uniref:Uncharacterized protein n=1 Tax=Sanghuangporus baumii TaxID=108892 RepID=A0A9Q5N5U5_SANBA|nr:hypothetical protein A7U60_g4044 [Sanghuangporus baumii]
MTKMMSPPIFKRRRKPWGSLEKKGRDTDEETERIRLDLMNDAKARVAAATGERNAAYRDPLDVYHKGLDTGGAIRDETKETFSRNILLVAESSPVSMMIEALWIMNKAVVTLNELRRSCSQKDITMLKDEFEKLQKEYYQLQQSSENTTNLAQMSPDAEA